MEQSKPRSSRMSEMVRKGISAGIFLLGVGVGISILPQTTAGESSRGADQPAFPPSISKSKWKSHIPQDNPMTASKVTLGKKCFLMSAFRRMRP